MSTKSRLKGVAAVMAASIALVGTWEGLRLAAYPDRLAGGIPTVCFGETRGVRLGDEYTVDECKAMLGVALLEFEAGMRECLSEPDKLPDGAYVAFLSASYNIGTRAFCGSSMARLANAGNLPAACDALLRWNKAGGRVVKGLTARRTEEWRICREGLK